MDTWTGRTSGGGSRNASAYPAGPGSVLGARSRDDHRAGLASQRFQPRDFGQTYPARTIPIDHPAALKPRQLPADRRADCSCRQHSHDRIERHRSPVLSPDVSSRSPLLVALAVVASSVSAFIWDCCAQRGQRKRGNAGTEAAPVISGARELRLCSVDDRNLRSRRLVRHLYDRIELLRKRIDNAGAKPRL